MSCPHCDGDDVFYDVECMVRAWHIDGMVERARGVLEARGSMLSGAARQTIERFVGICDAFSESLQLSFEEAESALDDGREAERLVNYELLQLEIANR